MKQLLLLLCIATLSSCSEKEHNDSLPTKSIEISYHDNVETVMILRSLSDTDYFISRIPDSSTKWPMLYRARQYFKNYKDHPAVGETQRLLYSMQDIGGLLFQGVLYAKELPETGLTEEPSDGYWREHKAELENYMQQVATFYKEANVEAFLKSNESFYNGAIAEAKVYIQDSVTGVMEEYFGTGEATYKIYLMPMCPYGWGFSTTTTGSAGKVYSGIISPPGDVEWDGKSALSNYGFGGEEAAGHYSELIIHEFVHPFITPILERDSIKQQIAKYEYLYTSLLDSAMGENGYSGWWSFVNELFTRLGHIRAMEQTNTSEADVLRNTDMNEYNFVLLPEAENNIMSYEDNRDKYKTIEDYIPELINIFSEVDTQTINSRILANRGN